MKNSLSEKFNDMAERQFVRASDRFNLGFSAVTAVAAAPFSLTFAAVFASMPAASAAVGLVYKGVAKGAEMIKPAQPK